MIAEKARVARIARHAAGNQQGLACFSCYFPGPLVGIENIIPAPRGLKSLRRLEGGLALARGPKKVSEVTSWAPLQAVRVQTNAAESA